MIITSKQELMPKGKYKGETVEFVLLNDWSYIIWSDSVNYIVYVDSIVEEALHYEEQAQEEWMYEVRCNAGDIY